MYCAGSPSNAVTLNGARPSVFAAVSNFAGLSVPAPSFARRSASRSTIAADESLACTLSRMWRAVTVSPVRASTLIR